MVWRPYKRISHLEGCIESWRKLASRKDQEIDLLRRQKGNMEREFAQQNLELREATQTLRRHGIV